jgi:type I restriction enzyme S subunit
MFRFLEIFGNIYNSVKYPYKAVQDLTTVTSGGTPSRSQHEYWENGTIPWVKTTELQKNILCSTEEYTKENA